MSTATLTRTRVASARTAPRERARRQWEWLAAGLALAFALPYVLTDLATINRDLYYGIYAAAVFGFCALWLRTGVDRPRALLSRNRKLGVLLGIVFACATAAIALTETATSHPHGLSFAAAIIWRGVMYGAADGVLLSAFPILAVVAAFSSRPLRERSRRALAGIGVLALAVSLIFTAVYHLGLCRLPRREAAQAADRRRRLERADARHAQPDRGAARPYRSPRRRRRSRLRHQHLLAAAQPEPLRGLRRAER